MDKGDMRINNLMYKQPERLSLAVNRTMKRQRFEKSTYTAGETAVINFNTGSDYVKCCNSYLVLDLLVTGTTPTANFGAGSAVNLIQRALVTTRSGTPCDRMEKANLFSAKNLRQKNSQDWIDNYGSMMGMGSTGIAGTDAANVTATAKKFVIPLSAISGFFDPVGGVLLPPMLAAGLEVQLTFADFRTALFQKAGTVTGYTISKISIMTDLVTLSDDTQKSLNFESASNGLEYVYPRYHTATSTLTSTAVSIQVAKAVSQAASVCACLVTQADVLDVTADAFASEVWNVSDWQVRVGSLYYPNEAIQDSGVDGVESFFLSQAVHDKNRYSHAENSISVVDFKTNGHATINASFERDQSLNLTGSSINNSRQVELTATLASWSANIEATVFLQYFSVAKAFIDNTSVSL
jgi:hypothetical protein